MFSRNMRTIYERLLILGLLSACLVVFSFSNEVESVFASVCYQDCEASRAMCDDSCMTSCG